MFDGVRASLAAACSRARRLERREVHEFRRWIESTQNLVHLSVLLFVPLLIAGVTAISNLSAELTFLLFPPLASGAYLLFAHPTGRYSSPYRFVAGLTLGALCGWLALQLSAAFLYHGPPSQHRVHAAGAALAMFLTGATTWGFDIEEPAAYSTALLALVGDAAGFAYVVSIAASSALVAGAFVLWHRAFYADRARYLYQSTKGDDHVLVPMRGEHPDATAMLGARLAAAHDAGKVVLLDIVDADDGDTTRRTTADGGDGESLATDGGATGTTDETAADEIATSLEDRAATIETTVGVPCEVAVVDSGAESLAAAVLRTAREANCDLIATPYEESDGTAAPYIRSLFRTDMDVLVHRSADGRTDWGRALVPVRSVSDVAHSMLEFACRLAGSAGETAVCHCIDSPAERRRAERMLADLVETFPGGIETRVPQASIGSFLETVAPQYDLVLVGASTDRSSVSRLLSPATFERLPDIDCDLAIVDRRSRPLSRE
ncbi:HPP family protein [Halococcus agarilyticus]|uniref:HPP family protein n=1 Tax=Halococcus agarilyticus TaxID=1232219 RepID=UPI000677F2DA|nr:HPP family protein [Halococcus agarilyticus]